jgi:hypothetical protein
MSRYSGQLRVYILVRNRDRCMGNIEKEYSELVVLGNDVVSLSSVWGGGLDEQFTVCGKRFSV